MRSPRGRLIVIGDIHGCYEELIELLERVDPQRHDLVVATGDMTRKGPDPVRCLTLWQKRSYLSVRGNNEEKLLQLAKARALRKLFLPREDRAVLRKRGLLSFIRRWPLVIDIPRLSVAVVHGGFLPRTTMTEKSIARSAAAITRLRWIRRQGREWCSVGQSRESNEDVLWAEVWKGPRTVLYGHTPLRRPRRDRRAIGLDTGCVYGGWLTAAIFDGKWRFERVRAKRQYAD